MTEKVQFLCYCVDADSVFPKDLIIGAIQFKVMTTMPITS